MSQDYRTSMLAPQSPAVARNCLPLRFSDGPRQAVPFSTVTAAFFHQARTQPSRPAARDLTSKTSAAGREVTYATLARRARLLAAKLRRLGVQPGDRVPLVVKRGVEMLVGIVAVLACGAQYVPLDGGVVPDSTLRVVLRQAGERLALVLPSTEYRVRAVSVDCVTVVIPVVEGAEAEAEAERERLGEYDKAAAEEGFVDLARPELGCYVIYTSGTTGEPKGVDVMHSNVTNLLCLGPGNLGIKPGMCVGQVLNISFDMAAWEILGCLCNGGTLVLRGSDWLPAIKEIDVLICTPSILAKYNPAEFPRIRTVATAGEPSNQRLADLWATHGTYYNCCGPTETTIVNTMSKHVPGAPLSIGAPTPNNSVYILDEQLNPVPFGEPGVMWAGGAGVSRGYIGLPEKTQEKYLPDPFANDGTHMYNTGDLGKWNEDGSIDILGRVDDQIKIKGFRVELDGVSASLSSGPGITGAVALFIDNEIHGFVSPRVCDLDALKEHLSKLQPYYAVPTKFHCMDELPHTANGKLDKRALREYAATKQSLASASDSNLSATSDSNLSQTTTVTSMDEKKEMQQQQQQQQQMDLSAEVPEKTWKKPVRNLVYRVFIVYRFLFSVVGIANLVALVCILATGVPRVWLSNMTAINLVLAVLIRQDHVINALYTICCSIPKSWPVGIRARAAKIYHLGGLHSSAAFCAGVWLLASTVNGAVCSLTDCGPASGPQQSVASAFISWLLIILFAVMFAFAYPPMRKKYHDRFELVHRFVGWSMLGLFWIETFVSASDTARATGLELHVALAQSAPVWLLAVATFSIALSWMYLRKVAVDAEVLSDHAVRLHFDYTVPVNGSFTRISNRPLLEWHSFATVPAPQPVAGRPAGYSLVVSNAGDWTRSVIQNPPRHLWVRSAPTCGVMRVATLFNRVVVIATGSGIGPLMGHIQNPSCATQLIWSTPSPEKTFGKGLLDTIHATIPDAVIHDTRLLGRPDLVRMGYNLAKSFGAEAVIIIANEKITKKVVYGLETRGVPAYGAIWDS
ncbi:hypothetical protein MCOR27_011701 [Pyricularia oryzae]|nr:hypothetical protein MCOR27_011701 [Pyricularia oryzae]